MSVEEYWAAVKALNLTQSKVPTVYLDSEGATYNVPDPARLPNDGVRLDVIRRLRAAMGVAQ